VGAAQKKGFDNISIDLIYGIPGMTRAQLERSLDEATELGVQHISAYHLTIEPGTAFGRQGLRPVPESESEQQFETLRRKLLDAGFEHYEISNFALPGRRAVHNSAYWSGVPYLGVGPSAHSFDGIRRREWVADDVAKYIAGPVEYGGETLSDRDLYNERVMTGLRTAAGVEIAELRAGATVERFLHEGLLVRSGSRVAIPPGKFLLSDWIIGELFEP
jgi:oxygen-independent coproporphyrinogen-3 oxidase